MNNTTRALCAILVAVGVTAAGPMRATAAANNAGFIHGTVTTNGGKSYTGVMRWGTEEAFWDDVFHSSKVELPYADRAEERAASGDDEGRDRDERWWQVFGRRINITFDRSSGSRVFAARFGDIERIEVSARNGAKVTMRSGETLEVRGYANDVGATITVWDRSLGEIELPWKKIDTIEFSATPADAEVPGYRLRGVVKTDSGEFEGYVQWDKQECLSIDKLDGDTDDGRLSVAMGNIRIIERRSRKSARIVLKDGREEVLDGTNDVNSSNRGILVEDARYGRVEIPWDSFNLVEFFDEGDSGPGYRDYKTPKRLRATVTDRDGEKHRGQLVFDLDETMSWEMLDGSSFDIKYSIPFDRVKSIEPHSSSSAVVVLKGGEEIRLEDSQDVSSKNDGLLVLNKTDDGTYIHWSEVKRIELE